MKKVFFSLAAILMINLAASATECMVHGAEGTVTVTCTCTVDGCYNKAIKAYEAIF
ncbi:MAG: hypothetical protein U5M51_11230 [Emticicia sp.]|nr:hypothetical protein [Emticicia sp.]